VIFRRRAVLALLTALFALALPAVASAAVTYTVDSVEDQPDKEIGAGDCETAVGTCTLRAAIQELNFSPAVKDKIDFDTLFNGKPGHTIALESALPNITDPILIDGDGINDSRCLNATFSINGPCVEITAPNASTPALVVDDTDDVTIEGLSITGSRTAINVIDSSSSFVAHGNWLGVTLDGTAAGNTTGIFLDPDSNGATIGGTIAADRNVFGNNGAEGLDIEGADNADVLGNYFGVKPDGVTQAANGKNIEISDTVAFEATGNEVGAAIAGPSQGAPCDGGCNVISGASSYGIDLQGNGAGQNEEPATGPTTIRGNYIGLSAAGTAVVANSSYGVWSVEAKAVTIGGEENGEGNFFAGGGAGIYHGDGEGFAAIGNIFGSGPTGADLTSPGLGVFVYCLNLGTGGVDPVEVSQNVFRMEGGIGIESVFGNADIEANFIEGAGYGIFTRGDPPGAGDLIADNVIGESTSNGILIENDFNVVIHNAIYDSSAAGIRIQDPTAFPILSSTGNLIGGSTAAEENTIRESGGDAIEIVDVSASEDEDSQNGVGRNEGDENAGLFIDLVDNANAGILPPTFATLQQSSASGSGVEPFATVRVFRKAEAIPGEIASTLAETTADGSGKWKVTYPAVPTGTLVAATQTSPEGGTSELAIEAASADPDSGKDDKDKAKDDKTKDGKKDKVAKDKKAPETTIVKGPRARSHKRTAKFKFVSSEAGSTFQCRLDKKRFNPCRSPKRYRRLKPGKHVFEVRAIDPAGNRDKTPATRRFRVLAG
jgi:CSLREA domain-containing protein